jgi:hypothetical protein
MKTVLGLLGKVLPTILTLLGTYVIGHNLMGAKVDESLWQEIGGAATAAIGLAISYFSHTLNIEGVQASIHRIVEVAGALLVASGRITAESLVTILGVITALTPLIYKHFSEKKTQQIASGKIAIEDLKGAPKPIPSPTT